MNLIGISWCKNEGDLLPWTLEHAIDQVDAMMIIDDDSDDNSWDVIKSFDKKLAYSVRKRDVVGDSRNHLLNEVRRRYGTKDTWIQVIESDTVVFDTDIRAAINKYSIDDIVCHWHLLNACKRDWSQDWDKLTLFDQQPWQAYTDCHFMELMTYSFRPLEKLEYTSRRTPWPQGFSHYTTKGYRKTKQPDSPLAMHYGYRTPRFFYEKMKKLGRTKGGGKYPSWNFNSPKSVLATVPFFNGTWNNNRDVFPATRQGWADWIVYRQQYLAEEGRNDENS